MDRHKIRIQVDRDPQTRTRGMISPRNCDVEKWISLRIRCGHIEKKSYFVNKVVSLIREEIWYGLIS